MDPDAMWYWFDIVYYYYDHLIFFTVLAVLVLYGKLNWQQMFGVFDRAELRPAIKLTVFVFFFSLTAAYLLYYPLSFAYPDFVQSYFIDTPDLVYASSEGIPLIANVLSFISLVFIAPAMEEFAFRGLLLHRWQKKWGLTKAILISSLIFGLTHPDPIGAIAFGIAMCILYLKSHSLWLPILCHALNNLVVWLIEAYYIFTHGLDYQFTLDEFLKEWYVGVISAIIVCLWAYLYLQGPKSKREWRLPDL